MTSREKESAQVRTEKCTGFTHASKLAMTANTHPFLLSITFSCIHACVVCGENGRWLETGLGIMSCSSDGCTTHNLVQRKSSGKVSGIRMSECVVCPPLAFLQAGDASGTGLLDVAARVWDPKLAALVDPQLQEWLPSLIGPSEVCTLTAWCAQSLREQPELNLAVSGASVLQCMFQLQGTCS